MARVYYLFWVVRVFLAVLWSGPQNIYCLGLETALPVWAASRLRRSISYVFDDADRLVLLWKLPRIVSSVLVHFERKVSRDSIAHIVPSLQRYDYRTPSMVEVLNLPNRSQVEQAWKNAGRTNDGRLQVYVNGWLDITRGLDLLDKTAGILEKDKIADVVFNVAASRVTGEKSAFFNRTMVNVIGPVDHLTSLAIYRQNDCVVTFYDPSIAINRFAVPNKWGDAIAMQTPVVLNEELVTATPLINSGMAFAVPFGDPGKLASLLVHLATNRMELNRAELAAAKLRETAVYFDEAMQPIVRRLMNA